jgi:D-arabinose 1-dehydrogenase-like Zn-dependent alcohol dehydrogenase
MGSPADFAAMVRLVEGRRIVPVIDSTLPLDQADDALRRMETSSQFGKIVLTVGC